MTEHQRVVDRHDAQRTVVVSQATSEVTVAVAFVGLGVIVTAGRVVGK